jgi:hypothetical protein
MRNKIISTISIGVALQWLSLFFSYRKLPNFFQGNINQSIATGGWPLKIFEYPVPPMGHDWPPSVGDWPIFFLNLLIWIAVGFILTSFLDKKVAEKRVLFFLILSAIILSILGLFYIMLKFD